MQEMQERWVQSLGQEDPLEEELTIHSSILAWKIPWREEPGGLQSMWSQESDTTEWLSTHALYFSTFSCKSWWSQWRGSMLSAEDPILDGLGNLLKTRKMDFSPAHGRNSVTQVESSSLPGSRPAHGWPSTTCSALCFASSPLRLHCTPTPALKHSSRPGSGGFWVVSLCDQLNIRWTLVMRITQEEQLFNNPIPLLPAEVRSLSCRFFLKGCPGWFTGAAS